MSVTTPYVYTNNQVLNPDEHNKNVYSKTPGEGIYSEINGGIDSYASTFKVEAEHVRPEQVTRARREFAVESLDLFSNAVSETDNGSFRPVAGCAVKVHVPYNASLSLWQWSIFIHPFKWRVSSHVRDSDEETTGFTQTKSNMIIRASLNGDQLPHTERQLPTSAVWEATRNSSGDSVGIMDSFEARACLQYDMCHLQTDVSAGWHDLTLRVYIEPLVDSGGGLYNYPYHSAVSASDGSDVVLTSHVLYQRVSFGIRNARVLTIL